MEGGVAVFGQGSAEAEKGGLERMPPEPVSADEGWTEDEDEDERMLPEPVSAGEEEDEEPEL